MSDLQQFLKLYNFKNELRMSSQMIILSSLNNNLLKVNIDFSWNVYRWEKVSQKSIENSEVNLGNFRVIEVSKGSKQKTLL